MKRRVFFDKIRLEPFRGALGQWTVVGCNAILDEWERRKLTDLRHLAYMLATVRGECGINMMPVREGFSKSDATARAFVARQGYRYAVEVNGQVYYGRGLVQLTWDYNYKKMGDLLGIDLLNNPDLALRPDIAAKILFEGMIRGTFTGKKLSDYFTSTTSDWVNARKIINGLDKAQQFATWGRQFHVALTEATLAADMPAPPDIPKPIPKPAPKGSIPEIAGGAIAAGGGAVIVGEAINRGASWGDIAMIAVPCLIIVAAVVFIIRHIRKG